MRSRVGVAIATLVLGLCVAPAAQAGPLDMLYAPLHVHGTSQTQSFIQSHFPTVSVSAGQLKKGWHSSNTGLYTKGTRSSVGTYPESWYLHTASGARIHDRALKSYFVMNPSSPGWRQQVVQNCSGAPQWCFVDAMGADGYQRMSAKPTVSESWWIQQTIDEANYVENASSKWSVMANNAITANNPNFAVGFEMFARVSAQQSLNVLEHTRCYCFAKLGTESGALRVHAVPGRCGRGRPHQRGHRLPDRHLVGLLRQCRQAGQPNRGGDRQRQPDHPPIHRR